MAIAVLIMAVAMTLVPLGDTAGKLLMVEHGFPPVTVAWLRFTVGALLTLPFVLLNRRHIPALWNWRLHSRGALITLTVLCILTGLETEDIGSVFGAFFVAPIISYGLSILLLGESGRPARVALLLLGFCGVLLVVKPGFGMTPGLGFAMLAGVFYGGYLTASRWISDAAPPVVLLCVQLTFGAVVLAPFAAPMVPDYAFSANGLLILSGGASLMGNLLLVVAYRRAPATIMAPLVYFQLVAATGFGAAVFGVWPDRLALAGLGLLLVSGLASLALRRGA